MKRFLSVILTFFLLISAAQGELSLTEKIENRSIPSIFGAWGETLVNRPELTYAEMTAYHDLFWSPEFFHRLALVDGEVKLIGDLTASKRQRDDLLALNPNMILIYEVAMRGAYSGSDLYKGDFPLIRSDDGTQVFGIPSELDTNLFIDFTHPKAQEIIVGQAIALAESKLYDGIFFDFWDENGVILEGYRSYEAEQAARVEILRRIREAVGDNFLIIVNNTGKLTRATPYINGIFMETFRADIKNYNYDGLKFLEDLFFWAEESLREPRINCLEAEGIGSELPTSPNNLRDMRLLATLSLTHSDGYFSYTMGVQWDEKHPHDDAFLNYQGAAFHRNRRYWITHREQHDNWSHIHHHEHYWNAFWDAELGRPIGEKAQLYEEREGLFIREFTNGWVVYNRSGKEQIVKLPIKSSGVESGITAIEHTLPDLDGEIYLKVPVVVADLNGDGVVNILDLVIVAGAFGVEKHSNADLNGDGTVNVLDLIFVAQKIGE